MNATTARMISFQTSDDVEQYLSKVDNLIKTQSGRGEFTARTYLEDINKKEKEILKRRLEDAGFKVKYRFSVVPNEVWIDVEW